MIKPHESAAPQLASFNVGRLRHSPTDPRLADFVDNLEMVNSIADRTEGFVWRRPPADDSELCSRAFGTPLVLLNLTVWKNAEALEKYVWLTIHKRFYARRAEWFATMEGPHHVMWWVAAGHIPSAEEAVEKLRELRERGPSEAAFGWERIVPEGLWKAAGQS